MSAVNKKTIVLNGSSLTPEEVYEIAHTSSVHVALHPRSIAKAKKSYDFLTKEVGRKAVYGITTGFGPMASHIIGKNQLKELQYNLIRSHAVGAGAPIAPQFVIAAMVDRLNTLIKGHSGVSPNLIEILATFINRRIIPIVPEHGAVGTSGDLVQLAHIALALIGEGEAFYQGERVKVAPLLKKLKIQPHVLMPKEGIALINGTSVMTGIAALLVVEATRLIETAIKSSALALELVNGLGDAFSEELHALRPHTGQMEIAKRLRAIFTDSKLISDRKKLQSKVAVTDRLYVTPEHIQEVYSFRCVPQILGPIFDILEKVRRDVTTELNSVTDNPIIDLKKSFFLHGGNFHGDYIATAVDQLKIGLVKLSLLSERRINFFLNRNVNQIFPPFLNVGQPGLTLALQGVQFVATSSVAQNQSFAYPHSLHSISTNADNQDVVSMGTDAALIAIRVLENTFTVLAIELVTLTQAADILKSTDNLSKGSKALYEKVRKGFPVIIKDRSFSGELNNLIKEIKNGSIESL